LTSLITRISEIVEFVSSDGKIINENNDQPIYQFKPIGEAKNGDISFCSYTDDKAIQLINESNASLIICSIDLQNKNLETNSTLIFVKNPRLWFMRCVRKFFPHKKIPEGIDKSAIVKSNSIGKNTSIGPHSYVEKDVSIGENCVIYGGVQVFNGTKIGNNVIIYPSVIIGDASFGPQRNESYVLETCQRLGGVNIGNDVEIGSNTSISPGFLEDTIIDDGTKISSQVYIGSGMKIGKNCMITPKTFFGGSCVLEDNVYIAPGVTIRNGVKISKNAFVGIGSVVVKDVPENTTVFGVPAKSVTHNSDTNAINNIK